MSIFALVDCNNFYVSCERAFNPRLENKPIVVLSNNDGCIISRSNEAKKLGIPMGAPLFKWKKFCMDNRVIVLSSNYELYGDMSHRVMRLLQEFYPETEIYSIDEAFLKLDGFNRENLFSDALEMRQKIKACTGIPVSIGYAQTKTLAKVANHIAKTQTQKGVFELLDRQLQSEILADFPLEKVWGIGKALAPRLNKLNIHTPKELRDTDPKKIRHYFNVVMEKMVQELRGFSCIPTETIQPRKQIISSRSFGNPVTELQALEEAVSNFAATASLKLREQKSVAQGLSVFIRTSRFNESEPYYSNNITLSFPIPTADTSEIIAMARNGVRHLFKPGYRYKKAGIMLLDLAPQSTMQLDFFNQEKPTRRLLMQTVDRINKTFGKNTVFHAAQGIRRNWQMKSDRRSPRYTTRWNEMLVVKS